MVSGRIDGWDPAAALVEEIKTTRADPRELHARIGSVNTAQLKLYGAMLALADPTLGPLQLRLVYLHPDKPTETVFEERLSRRELVDLLRDHLQSLRAMARLDGRPGSSAARRTVAGCVLPPRRVPQRSAPLGERPCSAASAMPPTG